MTNLDIFTNISNRLSLFANSPALAFPKKANVKISKKIYIYNQRDIGGLKQWKLAGYLVQNDCNRSTQSDKNAVTVSAFWLFLFIHLVIAAQEIVN